MPKKIGGLDQKQAIIVFVVVAVGVFLYLRHKGTNAAASVSAPSADQTGSPYPAQAQDSTGGASSAGSDGSDPLAALEAQFATTPPYYYYNTGNNTTTTNTYNTPLGSGSGSSDPSTPGGGTTTVISTSPSSSGGAPFSPSYPASPTLPPLNPHLLPGIGATVITSPFGGSLTVGGGSAAGGRPPLKV